MGKKKGTLKITLKSNLCMGSGYSFAGIVDSDVCYDEWGIPYIPAKRLKGCLRETAEMIFYNKYQEDDLFALFGKGGERAQGGFSLGNAYIENYNLLAEILREKKKDKRVSGFYDTQNILKQFSTVIGQTKMEKGVADDTTLRYTRVVNRYSPFGKKEMVFYAEVLCDTAGLWDILKMIAKGMRHIGLKRNRGMGNVVCELISEDSDKKPDLCELVSEKENPRDWILESEDQDGKVTLIYYIKNTEPLMMSVREENTSEDFISGQMVLGCMAGRYLKENSAYDEDSDKKNYTQEFMDLFLNGKTIYTNLYPCKDGVIHYPAPEYINRLKKTGKYVNTINSDWFEEITEEDPYCVKYGNQPKKLKGKYVSLLDGVSVCEVKKDICYHHSHSKKSASGEDGILYGMEVLRQGQMFAGEIILPKEYSEQMKKLLSSGVFYFGKSKSAQYGQCKLVNYKEILKDKVREAQLMEKQVRQKISKGQYAVVTFLADAILIEEQEKNKNYAVHFEAVEAAVERFFGIEKCRKRPEYWSENNHKNYISYIQTTLATGYMGTWNLRKDAAPAIRAGSCIVFCTDREITEGIYFMGERNAEGYGQIRVDAADRMKFKLEEMRLQTEGDDGLEEERCVNVKVGKYEEIKKLFQPVLLENWLEWKKIEALSDPEKLEISNTANGRFFLMLMESVKESEGNYGNAFENFKKRIASIKSEITRKNGEQLIKKIASEFKLPVSEQDKDLDKKIFSIQDGKIPEENEIALYELCRLGFSEDDVNDMVKALWSDYAKTILTNRKYEGRSK